jgi:hypothetical protein
LLVAKGLTKGPKVDTVSKPIRSRMMAAVHGRDTKPEVAVRKVAHSLGYRYRLHVSALPGKPDLVFPRYRLAMFVHGASGISTRDASGHHVLPQILISGPKSSLVIVSVTKRSKRSLRPPGGRLRCSGNVRCTAQVPSRRCCIGTYLKDKIDWSYESVRMAASRVCPQLGDSRIG